MTHRTAWPCAAAHCAILCALLAGCSTPTQAPPAAVVEDASPVDAPARSSWPAVLEQRWLARAALAESTGDLAQVALALDVLLLIDAPAYRHRRDELQGRIDQALDERLQQARQEHKKRRWEAAEVQYLRALALQPHNAEAAEALREIDVARNRRDYLGQPSRVTLTRRASVPATTSAAAAARIEASMELEHASMLVTQGETGAAISLLEARLVRDRPDAAARAMLTDLYYRKALDLKGRDDAAARAALARALQLSPGHAPSRALSTQLSPAAAALK